MLKEYGTIPRIIYDDIASTGIFSSHMPLSYKEIAAEVIRNCCLLGGIGIIPANGGVLALRLKEIVYLSHKLHLLAFGTPLCYNFLESEDTGPVFDGSRDISAWTCGWITDDCQIESHLDIDQSAIVRTVCQYIAPLYPVYVVPKCHNVAWKAGLKKRNKEITDAMIIEESVALGEIETRPYSYLEEISFDEQQTINTEHLKLLADFSKREDNILISNLVEPYFQFRNDNI